MNPAVIILLVAGSICASAGTFVLKLGAVGRHELVEFANLKIVLGLALYAVGSAAWIYCLSRAPLNVVYAFTALTFVLVQVSAVAFLGERIPAIGLGGMALIVCGIGLVAAGTTV